MWTVWMGFFGQQNDKVGKGWESKILSQVAIPSKYQEQSGDKNNLQAFPISKVRKMEVRDIALCCAAYPFCVHWKEKGDSGDMTPVCLMET